MLFIVTIVKGIEGKNSWLKTVTWGKAVRCTWSNCHQVGKRQDKMLRPTNVEVIEPCLAHGVVISAPKMVVSFTRNLPVFFFFFYSFQNFSTPQVRFPDEPRLKPSLLIRQIIPIARKYSTDSYGGHLMMAVLMFLRLRTCPCSCLC